MTEISNLRRAHFGDDRGVINFRRATTIATGDGDHAILGLHHRYLNNYCLARAVSLLVVRTRTAFFNGNTHHLLTVLDNERWSNR